MAAALDKRLVIGVGALTAVVIGVAVALGLTRGDEPSTAPPPAAEGGLQIEVGENQRASLDPSKPLRCFVKGEFVGVETLTRCAERNGVSAQALDVGLDESGEVAAATDVTLAPLAPTDIAELAPPRAAPMPALPDMGPLGPGDSARGAGSQAAWGPCMKHSAQGWSVVSQNAPLAVCVNLLFDGRCEQPGNAQYGRWGEQTVRLVPGKVEIARDGQTFTTLVEQTGDCMVPGI
jgi:hypothetical protein